MNMTWEGRCDFFLRDPILGSLEEKYWSWFFFSFGGAVLGLHCHMRAFSSCRQRGLLSSCAVHLIAVASLVAQRASQGSCA